MDGRINVFFHLLCLSPLPPKQIGCVPIVLLYLPSPHYLRGDKRRGRWGRRCPCTGWSGWPCRRASSSSWWCWRWCRGRAPRSTCRTWRSWQLAPGGCPTPRTCRTRRGRSRHRWQVAAPPPRSCCSPSPSLCPRPCAASQPQWKELDGELIWLKCQVTEQRSLSDSISETVKRRDWTFISQRYLFSILGKS